MQISLRITDAECPSAKMASQIMLAVQRARELYPDLHFWGDYGGKKTDLAKLGDLSAYLKKLKPGNYSLSDTDEGDGATEFRVSLKKEIVSFRLYRDVDPQGAGKECQTLTELFKQLYSDLHDVSFPLVSSVTALDFDYPQPRPPRVWGAFDPLGLVDFIAPSGEALPEEKKMAESLRTVSLPAGVERKEVEGVVLVNWLPLREDSLEKKLSRRCVWYYENIDMPVDPSFNDQGDRRIDVFDNQKIAELTFYDAATQTGFKAIGYDPHEKSYETDKVEQLERLLREGKVSGLPLAKAYLVVSKREFAVLLRPVARDHGLDGVLYADDSAQLWDPFPEGKWLN